MPKKEKPMKERDWKTVAVRREILQQLQADAVTQDRSVSWILDHILRTHYTQKK